MSDALPKRFDPRPVESKWYSTWRERDLFAADPADPREMFSMVIPPPNVTGTLHLGHALNNTLQDLLARHHRIEGKNVLWLPGTDHAGIATQVVVEREIGKEGKSRHDLGREAFVDRVWEWKAQSGARIIEQLQALGASCDWSRERFTMDPGLSRAVREAFVQLYHEGLIYRGESLVNWCPRCTTVLSDLESPHQPVPGSLWTLRYPFAEGDGYVEVATTRPETMLGDTAIAVHPDDDRYRDLVGRHVRLPLIGREIPVIADDFVDPEYGSGAVKVTPGHDPNDFECGRRHGLPAINLLHPDGRLNDNAEAYAGLTVKEGRERVLADLEAAGALHGEEPHPHDVPHCERCGTVVEPLLSDQWFMRMEPLAKPALAAVRDGRTRFHPRSWENTYFHWLENIRDWTISRQLWWGHRIPAWRCEDCNEWTVAVEDPPHCHACGENRLVQEEDVLDTWFSSGLWPFSTLGWPDRTPELERFYPTSVLSTGFDIIFFWVARMMMLGMHFMEDVPFRDVYIHPLVRDAEGKKMSKSKGNVIDPIELMSAHGTDALRFTLTALTAQGRDIKLGEAQLATGRTFVTKLWNAARFGLMNLEGHAPGAAGGAGSLYDRWITTRLHEARERYRQSIEEYRFNDAASGLYQFVWGELCDWYIELAKQTLQGDDAEARAATQDTLVAVLSGSLLTLHPMMPFITEEIFAALPGPKDRSLLEHRAAELETRWPRLAQRLSAAELEEMETFTALVGAVRQVRGELGLAPQTTVQLRFP
ncbi:MAG: valine--tRNA ligase, partial [Myxococcales bacterium]|nr:valine--tRNA ligase [Myxococcales bacterium]